VSSTNSSKAVTAIFVVKTSPADLGSEHAFHDWYDNVHIPQVMEVPGFRGATRYRLIQPESSLPTYLTVYQLDTPEPAAAVAEMRRRVASGQIPTADVIAEEPRPESALYQRLDN
jgi:hypothetical protein